MNDQTDFIVQLQKEFLDEVTFLLEQCEESYLKLENPAHRAEELSTIFRVAHSIKGSGAVVGFDDLAGFAHVVEDCLTVLRSNPDLVNAEIISLLLQAGDAFKTRVAMLKAHSSETWQISELKEHIKKVSEALKSGNTAVPSSPAPQSPTPPPTFPEVVQQVSEVTAPAAAASPAVDEHHANEETAPDHHEHHEHHEPQVEHQPVGIKKADEHSFASNKVQAGSVKVDPVRIDAVLDLVGELVVIKSQLLQEHARTEKANLRENEVLSLLDKTVRELQDKTLSMRMTSLKPLFLKVQRTVRDLAIKLSKPIEFTMAGEDIEIDRTMIELLNDPLIHIVRNAVDHGIEKTSVRKEKKKAEKGSISMIAKQAGGRIIVEIRDDGGGINRDKVKAKAVKLGIVKEGQVMTDQEVYDLIFAPGFSTADTVTDVSGRGVGLDVVKSNIQKLKGTIEIETEKERSSLFRISLPLTTAITEGIVVLINQIRFVIPMDGIRELLRIEDHAITTIKTGHECLTVRGKILPMIRMNQVMLSNAILRNMNLKTSDVTADEKELAGNREGTVVVVDHLGILVALTIDGVIGQSQVVVKPLGQNINTTNGVAGAAIMGDGKIALVLDIDGLVRNLKMRNNAAAKNEALKQSNRMKQSAAA